MAKFNVKILKFSNPEEFEWVIVEASSAIQAQVIATADRPDYLGVESNIVEE